MTKPSTTERRDELKRLLVAVGPWGIDTGAFAEKYGVRTSTVYDDLKAIGPMTEIIDANVTKIQLYSILRHVLMDLRKQYDNADTPIQKAKVARTLLVCCDNVTRFLEAWGEKETTTRSLAEDFRIFYEAIHEKTA